MGTKNDSAATRGPSLGLTRRRLLELSAISGAALVAACTLPQGSSSSAAPLRRDAILGHFNEPTGLNPITSAADPPAQTIMMNGIYDELVRPNWSTGGVQPSLALTWKQEDPLHWLFDLRQGVQFHKDYGEMTAEDIEFLFDYVISGNKPVAFRFNGVVGAKAVGKYQVRVTLAKPNAAFLVVTAFRGAMVVSKRAYTELGEQAYARTPVGTGPFEFVSWEAGSRIVLKKFAKYWDPARPKLDQVTYKIILDPFVRTTQLKTGEIDFLNQPSWDQVDDLKKTPGIRVDSLAGGSYDYIALNVKRAPLDKREVRQALSYAIDRTAIAKAVYFGHAIPDDGPLVAGYLGYEANKHTYPLTADLTKARALLAQAGFPNGFPVSLITSDQANQRQIVEIVAEQLKPLGIKVEIGNLDLATYNARVKKADFQMGAKDVNLTAPDTDAALYAFFYSTAATAIATGYNNPEVDRLLDQARAGTDSAARAALYRQTLTTVLDDASFIYIDHPEVVYAMKEKLVGFTPISNGGIYDNVADMKWVP
jgi:peptide/nickel transport system substrate-binding protein